MTLQVNRKAAAQVKSDPAVARELLEDGWRVAVAMAQAAPVDPDGSKGGAKSIRAELVKGSEDDPEVQVGPDRAHFYMVFQETGTEHHLPQPFMRPTANRFK